MSCMKLLPGARYSLVQGGLLTGSLAGELTGELIERVSDGMGMSRTKIPEMHMNGQRGWHE